MGGALGSEPAVSHSGLPRPRDQSSPCRAESALRRRCLKASLTFASPPGETIIHSLFLKKESGGGGFLWQREEKGDQNSWFAYSVQHTRGFVMFRPGFIQSLQLRSVQRTRCVAPGVLL